ncbi:tryptophan halogenase family protein [Gilvimarinus agarilyticus]|uniref:tryptophan halogenase family protein n=1 Tax=Gilvimarinus agarilyticus TaxID=679259 RepID=UPI00059F8B8D|nr:tryptophan halogenase family protein [Gilvimarinus agarilyticus]
MQANPVNSKPIRRLVIVGGGTAGWLTAAMLSAHLPRDACRITLIESAELGVIGVGESTIPPFLGLLRKLGINEKAFIEQTDGCYKLGIRFRHWGASNHEYFHPFGALGQSLDQHDFYQCWLRANQLGDSSALMAHSPCAALAEAGRFYSPATGGGIGASYALHMDATMSAQYFRRYACERGVERIEGKVVSASRQDNGHIKAVQLDNGIAVSGDFFIDCTGFAARLIEGELGVGYRDWSAILPCDRSVSVKTEAVRPYKPFTEASASKMGWLWRIPLKNSTGFGHVYSSRHSSDADAKSVLFRHLDAKRITDPQFIVFKPGHRRVFWQHNCLSVGLAAGFIEPLESTSIHLIARGIEYFLRYFPTADCDPVLSSEYNRRMQADFEEIRDFVLLHYCTSQRRDSPFWRDCASKALPESLAQRIALFKAQGVLRAGVDDLFRATSWYSIFEGMGIRPRQYHPRVDDIAEPRLLDALSTHRHAIRALVASATAVDDVSV